MDKTVTESTVSPNSRPLWLQMLRVLFFLAGRDELSKFSYKHLAAGLFCTWIVGIGRYWDDPCAYPLQHLGLGSVFYVFVLSFLLWLVFLPLRPAQWSYRQVLTYITLTSPPAIIYAIPVEKFLSIQDATNANLYFLIIVAVWRIFLMGQYLRLVARLPLPHRLVGMLFPVTTVITLLFLFDQHRAVFEVMGGFRHHLNPREEADIFLNKVVGCSWVLCPFAALCYFVMFCWAWRKEVLRLVFQHRIAVSILTISLLAGVAYGVIRNVCKSPSTLLCEQAEHVESGMEARALLEKAISLDPNNASAFFERARQEERDGNYIAALADCNRAISLDQKNEHYLLLRADLFAEMGRAADSLKDFLEVRAIYSKGSIWRALFPFTYLEGFGIMEYPSDRLPGASAWQARQFYFWTKFDDLAWIKMPHASIDKERAWALMEDVPKLWQLRNLKEALSDCNFMVSEFELAHGSAPVSTQNVECVEDSDLTRAYKMRGYTYELMGKRDLAFSDYERALAVVKDDPQSLFLKARLLKRLGRESEARDTFVLVKTAVSTALIRANAKDELFSKSSKACSYSVARYIQLMTDAELGEKAKVISQLMIGSAKEDNEVSSSSAPKGSPEKKTVLPTHCDNVWSEGCCASDLELPVKHWETGKLYQLIGMQDAAQTQFKAAINLFDQYQAKPSNQLAVLIWRARIFRSLGEKARAAEEFQKACSHGYGGSMPNDDLSAIDARMLVSLM